MKLKTRIEIDREKLIEDIYQATQLEHKLIDEVLRTIIDYLYGLDIIEYD